MSTPDAQTSYVPSALAVRPIPPGPLRTLTDTFAALSQRPTLAQMSAWLQNLQVEKVAGGQIPPDQDIRLYAELILNDTEGSCCKAKKVLSAQK